MILSIVLCVSFISYSIENSSSQIETIRMGVIPHRNLDQLEQAHQLLISYLEQELDLKIEWIVLENYQQQLKKFLSNEIDLTLFGGYGFVKANEFDQADPLVMRDIDFHFTSYFLVRNDSSIVNISDLQGQSLSFGSKLSTSGHLMPRFFLSTQGIVPESFFSEVSYSGAHDLTAKWVQNGTVDVGAVNSLVVDAMFKRNQLDRNKVKVLWKTPSYPDYVWTARKALPEAFKFKIIEAFLKLSNENVEHNLLLEALGAKSYFPANGDDFRPIRKIAIQLGMLKQ